jgi:hypothetical protein
MYYTKNKPISKVSLRNRHIDKILQNIESGNYNNAKLYLSTFLQEQRTEKNPIDYVKNISLQLCSFSSKLLANHNLDISAIMENDNVYMKILQCKTIGQLSEILDKVVREAAIAQMKTTTAKK